MQKVVLLFGFLALITAVCPVFAGEKYLLEQQCNQCRADTNQCYDDLDSSSGGVAAATMSEACVNMQATCDRVCNSSMGTSPDRYNYGFYSCKRACDGHCNLACQFGDDPDCVDQCKEKEHLCIRKNCQQQ
jgi:hypothetical protein